MYRIPTSCARNAAIALFVIVAATMAWLQFIDAKRSPLEPVRLEFEVQSRSGAAGRLIVDNQLVSNFQYSGSPVFQSVSVPVPQGPEPITSMRLDPLMQPGEIQLRNLRLVRDGTELAVIGADHLESLNPQATLTRGDGGWSIRFTGGQDFPALALTGIYPINTPIINSAGFGPMALRICWALGLAITFLLVGGLARSAWRSGYAGLLLFGGFFLVIFGLRLVTLQHFGDRVPNWDYWQMPWTVYLPFVDGHMTWQGMIAPINEHRIFFARLFSLGLFLVNGQWENLYEAAAMSGMHALTATGLSLLLWNAFDRRHAAAILLLVGAATGLPFTWENIIWANQSQFYFFVGFSVLTIWLLGMNKPFSARWWCGASAALAAQFTVGSGILAPVVVAGLTIYRLLRDRKGMREAATTLAAAAVLTGFASLFRIKSQSMGMMTKNLDQFIQTFGKTMSWPFTESIWLWILLWLPLVLLVVRSIATKAPWSRAEAWAVALGGWVLLNALGVGIFRGGFSGGPVSRYMDLTAVGMIANGLALVLLADRVTGTGRLSRWFPYVRAAWTVLMLGGVLSITSYELSVPAKVRVEHQAKSIANVREFLRTDDLAFLAAKRHYEIPHPDPVRLAAWLRSDRMREILPVSIRKPLPLEQESAVGFVSPGVYGAYDFGLTEPTWGSYGREGDQTMGTFLSRTLPAPRYRYLAMSALNRLSCRQDRVTMRFVDPQTGKGYRACSSRDTAGGWKTVHARVPAKPLVFEAMDNDPVFWVAFQPPRELSTFSFWSFRLIEQGPWVLAAGLALIALGIRRKEGTSGAGT